MSMNQELILQKGIHSAVVDENGALQTDELGRCLIYDNSQQKVLAVNPTAEVMEFLGVVNHEEMDMPQHGQVQVDEMELENRDVRRPWSRADIESLIHLYKKYEIHFKSTTVKNDKVWSLISGDLKTHTSEQCKNKFKYLKAKYLEKKDNMSPKASGAKAIRFEYFDHLNDIFGKEPIVTPVAIASSSKGLQNFEALPDVDTMDESEEETINYKTKKRKWSALENELIKYDSNLQQREENTERRHKETLERQDKALNILERMVTVFEKSVSK
ncbi:unnamed protein product [Callosobruchus maculatus]|uniref:Myb-like domain-containing protein n=1 Tax=Callosobruchus maculatus TaxID=64391 RepID=A0A653D3Z6_CALMS|nr:unnamed protein product [Callosobruchus maculatus]